ncbi:MAG: response regulator [Planctomycetota bacterium]|nr:response regulator [Planctomycetota bacterium]
MVKTQSKPTAQSSPRVLVVDDERMVVDVFREIVAENIDCDLLFASSLREAQRILCGQRIDLLVADVHLPDGNGLSLVGELHRRQPGAVALVISGSPSVDSAVGAMRAGAVDFVAKPFVAEQLAEQIRKALESQRARHRREDRLRKLRDTVRRLNVARKTVNKKVDLLCNDLIGAYSELSRQLDLVRVQEGYRRFVEGVPDLEQLLCHTMDWLLRQVGYCNIGIWLTSADSELQLGAFMKYTVAAEPELTGAVETNLLRLIARRGFVRLRESECKTMLTPAELKFLTGQDIVGVNCTYLGESLGVLLLFRDQKTPFKDEDVNAVKMMSPLFASSLAVAVRRMEGEEAEDSSTPDEPKQKRKPDPADWWKNGDHPPF